MKYTGSIMLFLSAIIFLLPFVSKNRWSVHKKNGQTNEPPQSIIPLPAPAYKSAISIEEALLLRRSVRNYRDEPILLKDIGQLLWAAQGTTSKESGKRTAPSAGALYPLEIYLVCGNVQSLSPAVYHYRSADHALQAIAEGDKRRLLSGAAFMQGTISKSAAVIVIAAEYRRTTAKYLDRGKRYVHMEAGHSAQNIYLQAVPLKIGTVVIGAFSDSLVKQVLHLPKNEEPLYLMPIGKF